MNKKSIETRERNKSKRCMHDVHAMLCLASSLPLPPFPPPQSIFLVTNKLRPTSINATHTRTYHHKHQQTSITTRQPKKKTKTKKNRHLYECVNQRRVTYKEEKVGSKGKGGVAD